MRPAGAALVKDETRGWLQFTRPVREYSAHTCSDVKSTVEKLCDAARAGRHCVGFISYEAANAFDSALSVKRSSTPLVWFREYGRRECIAELPASSGKFKLSLRKPGLSRKIYRTKIASIKKLLEAGATYQVNFTFPLFLDFEGDPFDLFLQLQQNQRSRYSAFIDCPDRTLCSVSPELFFQKEGSVIQTRPMKGTAPRLGDPLLDRLEARRLSESAKNMAENVMIVDMIRNDLGRISTPGSVVVSSLFDLEKYPTVYQATSTVKGSTSAGLWKVLQALFPCASVTGAPKVQTMKIINKLEQYPRGVYTGAIGYVSPEKISFNVGIRTLDISHDGTAVYGTGSGIIWESDPDSEYDECLAKASVLFAKHAPFELIETLLWQPGRGYALSSEHVERLSRSADYFNFKCTKAWIRRALAAYSRKLKGKSAVRLLLAENGKLKFETRQIKNELSGWKVALASKKVDSSDCFLYHKTTQRSVYERAQAEFPEMDDVILRNERNEITESCKANVVAVLGKAHYTPPVSCGLLAGTMRARLLRKRAIKERVITVEDLKGASEIYLINSVRGKIPIVLEDSC